MVDCKALKDVRRILGTNALSCSKYMKQKLVVGFAWIDFLRKGREKEGEHIRTDSAPHPPHQEGQR